MGKRGNGEGSVYQRGDGKWCASVILPDGKRRVLYGKTRKDAADKLRAAQANIKQSLPIPAVRETVAKFLERWLKDVAAQKVRASTLERYTGDVRRHVLPALGRLKLAELTPQTLQTFINGLSAKALGPRSVIHCRAVLRVALGRAQHEGLIGQNAAKLVSMPRQVRKPVAALAPADARALLDAFKGHDLEAVVTVALATGLRQGELLGVMWDDFDPDTGTLTIRRQLQRQGGMYQLTELKTAQSRRTLALPRVAMEAMRTQRARQAELRLKAGPAWQDSHLVFTSAAGGYQNGSSITHRFQGLLKAAGLPVRPFHQLRHGAASLLLAQGASMRVVMEQLGHSQINLAMNLYAHVGPALMRDAADRMEAALGGA